MRSLISGLTAGLTALILGTLIAGAADSARAADAAAQQTSQAIASDQSTEQTAVDAATYRAQLQEAVMRLNAAYADLSARDAAYRELLATSQSNADGLQAANARLQQQLVDAAARVQQAEAQARAISAPVRRETREAHD